MATEWSLDGEVDKKNHLLLAYAIMLVMTMMMMIEICALISPDRDCDKKGGYPCPIACNCDKL